jgi:hypothetical protein
MSSSGVSAIIGLRSARRMMMASHVDPLLSWRETPTKQSIVDFVAAVTDPESDAAVPEVDRVAVFDNDGTLWAEIAHVRSVGLRHRPSSRTGVARPAAKN